MFQDQYVCSRFDTVINGIPYRHLSRTDDYPPQKSRYRQRTQKTTAIAVAPCPEAVVSDLGGHLRLFGIPPLPTLSIQEEIILHLAEDHPEAPVHPESASDRDYYYFRTCPFCKKIRKLSLS